MIPRSDRVLLERIQVQNFKSFDKIDFRPGKFNVLIGSNASGKSNFIQVFNFLRDISEDGVHTAIGRQEGVEFLRNVKIGSQSNSMFELDFHFPYGASFQKPMKKRGYRIEITHINYRFEIKFGKKSRFRVVSDIATCDCEVLSKDDNYEQSHRGKLSIYQEKGRIKLKADLPEKISLEEGDFDLDQFSMEGMAKIDLMLEDIHLSHFLTRELSFFLERLTVYNFDTKIAKMVRPSEYETELEDGAANMAAVLKKVIENPEDKRKFENLITEILPFMKGIGVEREFDTDVVFKLKEAYSKDQTIPSDLISNGTFNMITLVILLYFQDNPLIIIEEPERGIHPSLMGRLAKLMKDTSQTRQIIIATHSPELVRHAGIENIRLISRTKEGFSSIHQLGEFEEVNRFLENGMQVAELYVQDLLGD